MKKWLVEQAEKASIEDDKKHLRWVHPYLFDQKLSDISKDMLDGIKDAKKGTGVSNATVNSKRSLKDALELKRTMT
ncbi:hypothetical protein [Methylomonas sp. 2B]|uniref:hypothetical protein n=1 Tax=Methylomonas sp. 2B TaxID=3367743 RepID=UPI0037C8BF5F